MFLDDEKRRYTVGKAAFPWLSPDAKAPGRYRSRGRLYDFCIPAEHAAENLFEGVRTSTLEYFRDHGIAWHHGIGGGPSNHLASSMVCGVNFLGPLMHHRPGATALLREAFGEGVVEAVPVASSRLVEFEWVGDADTDYLHEGLRRTRGANATSADAAMAYRRPDGAKTLVLVEWKYTESYSGADKGLGEGAATRQRRYAPLVAAPDGPIDTRGVRYDELTREPFYQFMRQQLLAWRMEVAGREHGAAHVRVLHLSPRANRDFERITSPTLAARFPNRTATQAWRSLLRDPAKFTAIAIEDAFTPVLAGRDDGLDDWRAFIRGRYAWAGWRP
jgi:hypothetical protein